VILFRINALSRVYEESLSQSRIPFKSVGGVAFFQRKEIKDLMAYLRLILNPNDTIAFMRVANVPPRQIGETTLAQLQQQAQEKQCSISELVSSDELVISSRGRANVLAFMDLIHSLSTLYAQLTTDRMGLILKAIIEKTGYKAMLTQSSNPQDQERLENILQFISISREEELSLSAFITKLSLATELESNTDATTDAVTLMTMHHAKGLEFDTVFVVGMEEGILPHYRALNEPDEMEEERRLCYVALTRGKVRVHVSGAQQRNVFGEPRFQKQSRFIKEMPNACCTFSGVQALQGGGKSVSKWGERGPKVSPRAYPGTESVQTYAVGQAVLHAAWGQGVVSRVDGAGADAVIYIQFSGQLKKLLARYAPLVPVGTTSTRE